MSTLPCLYSLHEEHYKPAHPWPGTFLCFWCLAEDILLPKAWTHPREHLRQASHSLQPASRR